MCGWVEGLGVWLGGEGGCGWVCSWGVRLGVWLGVCAGWRG